jgi:plasmid stability protein
LFYLGLKLWFYRLGNLTGEAEIRDFTEHLFVPERAPFPSLLQHRAILSAITLNPQELAHSAQMSSQQRF